jgi:hypothetical protein
MASSDYQDLSFNRTKSFDPERDFSHITTAKSVGKCNEGESSDVRSYSFGHYTLMVLPAMFSIRTSLPLVRKPLSPRNQGPDAVYAKLLARASSSLSRSLSRYLPCIMIKTPLRETICYLSGFNTPKRCKINHYNQHIAYSSLPIQVDHLDHHVWYNFDQRLRRTELSTSYGTSRRHDHYLRVCCSCNLL